MEILKDDYCLKTQLFRLDVRFCLPLCELTGITAVTCDGGVYV